jgi:Flp pilus assembly protein TadD
MEHAPNQTRGFADPGHGDPLRDDRRARIATGLALLAVLVVAAVAYAPSLDGDFVLDDDRSVQMNMAIRRADALRLPSLPEMLGAGRPVTTATFALDWRAAGMDPWRFHVTGLGLHLAATVLAFVLLSRLLARVAYPRPRAVALVVAAMFALHPIQAESVAYVSQRAEVLSTLLYLAALLALDGAVTGWRTGRGLIAWAAGIATWTVAMGAKAIAISLPGAFLLDQVVLAPEGERGGRAAARRALRAVLISTPVLVLSAWSAVLQFGAFEASPGSGAGFTATTLSAWQYFLTQLRVQCLYLRLLAWPRGLAFDRSFEASRGVDPAVVIAGLGVAALVGLALWLWLRAERGEGNRAAARICAFGILFWFVALAPTSSFVPVMDLAVEHRVYLASLGPFLAAAVAFDVLVHRWLPLRAPWAATATAVLVLAGLGSALRARAETWSSAEALWREADAASPGSERIVTNLAIALRRKGDLAGAEATFRRAWPVVRKPEGVALVAQNHGALLIDTGRPAEALVVLDRGIAAVAGDPVLWVNRAVALGMLGRYAESLADARRAAQIGPDNPATRNTLGIALCAVGEWRAGQSEFQVAEALDPGNPIYPVTAAIALGMVGRREEACATYRRARATTRVLPLPRNAAGNAAALGCPIE